MEYVWARGAGGLPATPVIKRTGTTIDQSMTTSVDATPCSGGEPHEANTSYGVNRRRPPAREPAVPTVDHRERGVVVDPAEGERVLRGLEVVDVDHAAVVEVVPVARGGRHRAAAEEGRLDLHLGRVPHRVPHLLVVDDGDVLVVEVVEHLPARHGRVSLDPDRRPHPQLRPPAEAGSGGDRLGGGLERALDLEDPA